MVCYWEINYNNDIGSSMYKVLTQINPMMRKFTAIDR